MSSLREPVGPKDRKVYIRRRLIVLAGLLAIIAVIVLLIVKPGADASPKDAANVEVPQDLVGDDSGDAADTKEAKAADGDASACAAGQLVVTPISDKTDYAAGELPQIALMVENTGTEDCTADLGTAGMEFAIASGDDEVWRSTDCQENPESLAVILKPGKPLTTEVVAWDRTRSSTETCDITRDPVSANGATYHLRAAAAGVQGSGTAPFLLY